MNFNKILKNNLEELVSTECKAKMLYTVCLEHINDEFLCERIRIMLEDETLHEQLAQNLLNTLNY